MPVGLTGGIGSGKSTVCKVFEALGVPVFYADDEAKQLYTNPSLLQQISKLFGAQTIDVHGNLNRAELARVVFNNPEQLSKLNALIHPLVTQRFQDWVSQYKHVPYIIKEAAILFESGTYKQVQSIIHVSCPLTTRIQRVMQRDMVDEQTVMLRVNQQWTDEQRTALSDFSIDNSGNQLVLPQILTVHQALLIKASA